MKMFFTHYKNWLLPAVLILFILQAVTFPFALGQSWAESDSPDYLLTYTKGRLAWSSGTVVDEAGAAQFSLFDSEYKNANGDTTVTSNNDVVAPGTDNDKMVRLYNRVSGSVTYKAVLYQLQASIHDDMEDENGKIDMADKLNTEMRLLHADEGKGYVKDDNPFLPKGVKPEQVIKAVTGRLQGGQYQDFDISWLWKFEDEDPDDPGMKERNDQIDTLLGSLAAQAAEGEIPNTTVGLYIVVEDNNSYTTPESPATRDNGVGTYLALMAVCGGVLLILQWEKRKASKCGE